MWSLWCFEDFSLRRKCKKNGLTAHAFRVWVKKRRISRFNVLEA